MTLASFLRHLPSCRGSCACVWITSCHIDPLFSILAISSPSLDLTPVANLMPCQLSSCLGKYHSMDYKLLLPGVGVLINSGIGAADILIIPGCDLTSHFQTMSHLSTS